MTVVHAPGGPSPVPPMVSQKELFQLERLTALTRQKTALRKSILAKLLQGAAVEPGVMTAQLDIRESRCGPSWERLTELLGKEIVATLRAQMGTRAYPCLRIEANKAGSETSSAAPVSRASYLVRPRPSGAS